MFVLTGPTYWKKLLQLGKYSHHLHPSMFGDLRHPTSLKWMGQRTELGILSHCQHQEQNVLACDVCCGLVLVMQIISEAASSVLVLVI